MLKVPNKNTQRLLDLAAFFDTLDPNLYRQDRFVAGDAHCICGWTNIRAGYQADDQDRACELLGITKDQGRMLFGGGAGKRASMWSTTQREPRPKDAARCLRHLAVTGEIPGYWNAPYSEAEICEVA